MKIADSSTISATNTTSIKIPTTFNNFHHRELQLLLLTYARRKLLRRSSWTKDGYLSILYLHSINKHHSLFSGFGCSCVINAEHFFSIW